MIKVKNLRDAKWLIAVREMECVVCNATPCEPAHIRLGGQGGIALKPPDDCVVPLCHAHHAEQHRIGERTFWSKKFAGDPIFMIRCLTAYAKQLYLMKDTP
jgi:hypothetical protein